MNTTSDTTVVNIPAVRATGDTETLHEENKLLLDQLVQVQNELVRIHAEHQELQKQRNAPQPAGVNAQGVQTAKHDRRKSPINRAAMALRPLARLKPLKGLGIRLDMSIIRDSGLFDATWYASKYPDVAKSGANPIRHYLLHGAKEGRNPAPGFHTNWYLKTYPDVAKSGVNPLLHFIVHGREEGRRTQAVAQPPLPPPASTPAPKAQPTQGKPVDVEQEQQAAAARELDKQTRLAAERLTQVERWQAQATAHEARIAELLEQLNKLELDKTAAEDLASKRQGLIEALQADIDRMTHEQAEIAARQARIKEELMKTEGHVNLVNRLLLPAPGEF